MISVRLGWTGARPTTLHAAWRAATSAPPPVCTGLLARQWQLEPAALRGYYLFEDDDQGLTDFLGNVATDPAFHAFATHVTSAQPERPQVARLDDAPRLDRPIFIIGAPRSGSTLLFDLLAQAPGLWTQGGEGQGAVDGVVELHPATRDYVSDRLTDADVTDLVQVCVQTGWRFGLRDRDGHRYDDLPETCRPVAPRLLDKTTEHSLRVAFLARLCPDAQFILLHRDARQSVSSLMYAWRHGGFVRVHDLPEWPQRDWCFLLPPDWRALVGRSLQAVATAQWEAANHWALNDLETLDTSRWTCVDYNELIARPRQVVARLCTFLDLEFDDRLAAQLSRPLPVSATAISPPSTIKWRSNQDLDVKTLEEATRTTSARLRTLHGLGAVPAPAASPIWSTPQVASAVRFSCHLADVPVNASDESTTDTVSDPLIVDPELRFQPGASIPLGLATTTRFRERFLADQPILWTRDKWTRAYRPFWIARHEVGLFSRFEPGAPVPPCPPAVLSRLRAMGVAESPRQRDNTERRGERMRARLGTEFSAHGFCVVPGVFGAPHTAALARYFRELAASGRWVIGDEQVARRRGWHNEGLSRFFHHQLTGLVSDLVGEPVCPSYTYVSAYQQGAELSPHIDRKQCEYTFSVIIDENGGRSADWPLWFLVGAQPTAVVLNVGEGVLFRGHDLPHWREAAPQPRLALSTLLLHYVPIHFREILS